MALVEEEQPVGWEPAANGVDEDAPVVSTAKQNATQMGTHTVSNSHDLASFEDPDHLAAAAKVGKSKIAVTRQGSFEYVASARMTRNSADDLFNENFREAQEAIREGVHPELIPAGSSGSYFVKDRYGHTLAVFKPRDEEPFAPLNPKWPKFFQVCVFTGEEGLQRWLCFCCFGRACLIPNHGYLSETGASLVDDRLYLNVVPKTRVVKIESPVFMYGRCCGRPRNPYPKEGSYQLFVHDHEPANVVLARWQANPELLNADERERFTYLFQKMCVLDYVIRNTDRHTDNWLIKHVPGKCLEVAAIDNGLAFPVKHPEYASRFRHFPFKWVDLEWAQSLREPLLELLTPTFVHNLCEDIKRLFRHDLSTNRMLVYNQLRVLRGQLWNLRVSLSVGESPAELAQRAPIIVRRRYKNEPEPGASWTDCFRVCSADPAVEKATMTAPP